MVPNTVLAPRRSCFLRGWEETKNRRRSQSEQIIECNVKALCKHRVQKHRIAVHFSAGRQPRDQVLDIGCGWGRLLEWYADHGAYATGVTLSSDQAASANSPRSIAHVLRVYAVVFLPTS